MKRMLLMALAVSTGVSLFASVLPKEVERVQAVSSDKLQLQQGMAADRFDFAPQSSLIKKLNSEVSDKVKLADDIAAKFGVSKQAPRFKAISVAPKSVSDAVLSESFESYSGGQGTFSNSWLPSGWTATRTEGIEDLAEAYFVDPDTQEPLPAEAGLGTWFVESYYSVAPQYGDATAGIFYLTSATLQSAGIEQQDEWLISPEFTVGEGNFLQFYSSYIPYLFFNIDEEHLDMNSGDWIEQETVATMKVMISTNNGSSWTELYDLADQYMGISFIEIYMNSSNEFLPIAIDLSDYAGQKVKLAFEYVGKDGGYIYVDNISVGVSAPEACYYPYGALYAGWDETTAHFSIPIELFPANVELPWVNTSSEDSNQFMWTYNDPSTPYDITAEEPTVNELTSTDVNLMVSYPAGYYVSPILTATGLSGGTGEYSDGALMQVGGGATVLGQDVEGAIWGSYEVNSQELAAYINIGMGSSIDSYWTSSMGPQYGADDVKVTEMSNMFYAPAAPYSLSRITVIGLKTTIDPTAQFDLAVVAIDDEGYLTTDTLAVAHCTANQLLYPLAGQVQGGENLFVMPFDLLTKDQFGFEMPATISVDCAINVSFTASNLGNSDFSIYSTVNPDANEIVYARMGLSMYSEGALVNEGYLSLTGSYAFQLNAQFLEGGVGVDEVGVAASAAKVAVVGGDFVVTAPEAINAVTVYNVAGQAVAASEVAGTTTVSGQSLAKGVYILRFNDGSSVKVVK